MKRIVLFVVGALLLAGCGGGDQTTARHPGTTTTGSSTTPPTSTPTTASTGSASTAPPSTAPTTTSSCAPTGSSAEVRVDYPNRMGALVGNAVRTAAHPCYERFVIELAPADAATSAFPGYWVRVGSGSTATLNPQGQAVTIKGTAILLVSMGSPMTRTDGSGYQGSRDIFPTRLTAIQELRLIEDFEGQSTWAIGLDRVRNFAVSVFTSPPRLVVDIDTSR